MRRAILLILSTVIVLTVAGVAFGAIPDSDGVIHGCYLKGDGGLRVIDTEAGETCRSAETELLWNQTGPQGPQGPQGEQGPPGPAAEVIGYAGTRIPIGFQVPATWTEIGHITLPAGFHMMSASVSFNNPSDSEVLVQCEFRFHEAWLRLDARDPSSFFDAGSMTLEGWTLNSEQTVHALMCKSTSDSTATASVVGGEITAIHVTSIRLLG